MKEIFVIILSSLIFVSCSIAPLNSAHTARSLGKDTSSISVSLASALGLRIEQGLTDKLDLGIGLELQSETVYFVQSKYSFINRPAGGLSLAGIGGVSLSSGYSHAKSVYLGPIVSYRYKDVELFFQGRFNYTHWNYDELHLRGNDTLNDLIVIPSTKNHFTYWQLDPGISFLGEKWSTSLGMHYLVFEDHTAGSPFIYINYHF